MPKSFLPTDIIAEILGRPSEMGFNPANEDFICPYIKSKCTKRSTADKTVPYPVCTLTPKTSGVKVAICPKRFYGIDILSHVVKHAWLGRQPQNPVMVSEVQMEGFGNVDFVITDIAEDGEISQFISCELQAIDITGSVRLAYDALISDSQINDKFNYGFNWRNVSKRYITQLISKGYYHHHWNSRIVAIIQDVVYDYFKSEADFPIFPHENNPQANIVFMVYGFDEIGDGKTHLTLKKVEGTHHSNLQNAILYKAAPNRDVFIERIKTRMDGI